MTSIIEEIPSSPERQLMAVYQSMGDTEMPEANAENSTYEVVVAAEEFLETPSKKKRKEELGLILVKPFTSYANFRLFQFSR